MRYPAHLNVHCNTCGREQLEDGVEAHTKDCHWMCNTGRLLADGVVRPLHVEPCKHQWNLGRSIYMEPSLGREKDKTQPSRVKPDFCCLCGELNFHWVSPKIGDGYTVE